MIRPLSHWRELAARLAILGLLLQPVAMLVPMPFAPASDRVAPADHAGVKHTGEDHAAAGANKGGAPGGSGKHHPASHPCQICLTLHIAGAGIAPAAASIAAPWCVSLASSRPDTSVRCWRSDVKTAPPRGPPALGWTLA